MTGRSSFLRRWCLLLPALAFAFLGCRSERAAPPPPSVGAPAAATLDSRGPPLQLEAEVAANGIRRYYVAIEARDYRTAYALWGQGGAASGKTYARFAAGFAGTAHSRVEIKGAIPTEGAAGSIYAVAPVVVRTVTTAGESQRFEGTYTLRRVNDVPGATPELLRWHLASAQLAIAP